MDARAFDALAKTLSVAPSRRGVLRLLGAAAGLIAAHRQAAPVAAATCTDDSQCAGDEQCNCGGGPCDGDGEEGVCEVCMDLLEEDCGGVVPCCFGLKCKNGECCSINGEVCSTDTECCTKRCAKRRGEDFGRCKKRR